MNAVNLIPIESRRIEAAGLPGMPFLGLLAALVLALAGTIAFVDARNVVSARRAELTQLQAGTAEWDAAAAKYAPAVAALRQRARRFVELGSLMGQRADWSLLLAQLAGVMPPHAELSSLAATANMPTGTPAPSGPATGAASTASTASTTGGTAAGASATAAGITIAGCATSQSVVADTMVALRRISGVSQVSLSSSQSSSSGTSSGASTGGCRLPVQFNLTLAFSPALDATQMLRTLGAEGVGVAPATAAARPAADAIPAGAAR